MLVKGERGGVERRTGAVFVVLVSVILIALLFTSNHSNERTSIPSGPEIVFCDLENVKGENYVQDGYLFSGAERRSDRRAHSGTFSSRLGREHIYGLGYNIENPVPGAMYEASVWMSRTGGDRGKLAISASDESFYKEVEIPVSKTDDGWELLQLFFTVPENAPDFVKVYVYVPKGSGDVYFDDLNIQAKNYADLFTNASSIDNSLHLYLTDKRFRKLEKKKWDAVATGILITEESDWVKGAIQMKGNINYSVNMRLKGDWLDHLSNKKWSFRIKVKNPNAWNDMITFSVQSPATRMFLYEWLYHKFLEEVDVLTPRYDFVDLTLNKDKLGVYAFEEHFDKQLVENKKRREGPILKLTEEGFWMSLKLENDFVGESVPGRIVDAYWESDIKPFKEKRTQASPGLAESFTRAQNLLFGFKYGQLEPEEVFDLDRFARYHAMTDLYQAYHGYAWHNIRFYYNPVTARLEPIGYDGYGRQFGKLGNGPIFGYYRNTKNRNNLLARLFADPGFVRLYHHYLDVYTQVSWFDKRLSALAGDIEARRLMLSHEYPDATIDIEFMLQRARLIRNIIRLRNNESLRVRTVSIDDDMRTVALFNYHALPLDAIGYSNSGRSYIAEFDKRVFIPRDGKYAVPKPVLVKVPMSAKSIVFAAAGLDSMYYSEISAWSPPEVVKYDSLSTGFDADRFDFIDQMGSEIVIRSGRHTLSEDLDLPTGSSLLIEPGTVLDVIDKARIVVRGQVFAAGTEEEPILFSSSDKTASGFHVINAGAESELYFVEFKGFNTQREAGWTLTGAVTFYESDVKMRNCRIIDNLCEDALNTIRSHIDIDGLYIANTAFDGFDADFCDGRIENARFENTGNDAIDFSGSSILISQCIISGAGDKGISVGEESRLIVEKAVVEGCNIAVASKDMSLCEIRDIDIKNCKQGFTAYQKKAEFGPARLEIGKYSFDNVRQPYLIERGSTLKLGDREIKGE
jgi:CotH protein/parallel beta helix pectate lyase-like protein